MLQSKVFAIATIADRDTWARSTMGVPQVAARSSDARDVHGRAGTQFAALCNYSESPPICMLLPTIFVSICLISVWVYFRRGRSVKRAVLTAVVLNVSVAAMIWGGPLSSGALFLLWPAPGQARPADLPYSYRPVHKGHVDLATGLYIREDDDVIVSASPAFVWRRAYLSRDRVARQLGIGTMHNADSYLIGDLASLTIVELITETGSRVEFDRTSRGTSYLNAMLVHTGTLTGYFGARLGWTGKSWALRFAGGELAIFQACDTPEV